MSIFVKNLNTELLISVEYMRILFSSNAALETVIHEVSMKNFGRVSRIFAMIKNENQRGKPLNQLLPSFAAKAGNENLSDLLRALNAEAKDIDERLEDISKHIMDDKRNALTKQYDRLNTYFSKILLVMIAPLAVYLADILKDAFGSTETLVNPETKIVVLVIAGLIFISAFVSMRYREK